MEGRLSQKLKEWWSSGGFFQVGTMLLLAGITWGTTVATVKSEQQAGRERLDSKFGTISDQLTDLKSQISTVRQAQDAVLQLRAEFSALSRRVESLEDDYKTQIQLNAKLMADIARLQVR